MEPEDCRTAIVAGAPDQSIGEKLASAIVLLFQQDSALLVRDVHERTIAAALAVHLRPEFIGWDVDVEYNRDGHEAKRADGKLVFPDIIIHRRGIPDNLLVIELKKSNTQEPDELDLQKLRSYRDVGLAYQFAVFLKLTTGDGAPGITRIVWV